MQPTFISIIKRPTSGPLLWLYALNRSFIWMFFPVMKPKSGSFQAASTPTKTIDSLRQCYFQNTCPIQKIAAGHQSNRNCSSPCCPYHSPSSCPAWHSTSKCMSYLLKKKCSFLKCIIYQILGVLRTFPTHALQIFTW